MANKDIMLIFLSDAKFSSDWKPSLANYANGITDTRTTNESAIRYILNKGIKLDYLFVFETEKVKKDIYREKDGKYYQNELGNHMTHVEYFRQTMMEYLPEIMDNSFYQPSDFNVGLNDIDGRETMNAVIKMADKIQSCVDLKNDNVTLHVDCTGGFRSANIAILAVVRLLEYAGVHIGKVVYSNYVRDGEGTVTELRELYNLFNLIAGAEEFTNFGSVKALDKYFKSIPNTYYLNDPINKLLRSMRNFSRSIRLCMPGIAAKNAIELMKAIHEFKTCKAHGIYEKMFSQLITNIENEYEEFSHSDTSDATLNIIKWCIRQELWQQAITFSFERLPEYICTKEILNPVDESVKKCKNKIHHEWQQCFIINYQVGKLKKGTTLQDFLKESNVAKSRDDSKDYIGLWNKFIKEKEKYINSYLDENDVEIILSNELLNDISDADKIIKNINKNKEKIKDILEQHGVFARLLRYLYYVDGNKTIDFYGYVLNLRKKTIIEKLCLSNTDNFIIKDDIFTLVNILKIYKNNCSKNEIKYIENAQKKYNKNDESYNSIWNSVERFWRCCIEQNRVTSIENNPDKIIAVLKSYSDLRDVRNKLNHANFTNVSNETSEELEKEVINVLNVCVKSIEDIIKSK